MSELCRLGPPAYTPARVRRCRHTCPGSLDIPIVDRDHRQLIDLLTRAQLPNQGPDVYELVQATVNDLADHVAHHFDRKEMLMRLVAFPDAARHCKSHSAIAARVREFQSLLRRSPARFPRDRFCAFLSGPILSHLLDEDMQIRPRVDRLTGEAA